MKALKSIWIFIESRQEFSLKEIEDYVKRSAGTTILNASLDVGDYLEILETRGVIERVSSDKWKTISNILHMADK